MTHLPAGDALDPVGTLHFIDRHYSLDELRTLCFELGADYDNLPGEGKKGKARPLHRMVWRLMQWPPYWWQNARATGLSDRRRTHRSGPRRAPSMRLRAP